VELSAARVSHLQTGGTASRVGVLAHRERRQVTVRRICRNIEIVCTRREHSRRGRRQHRPSGHTNRVAGYTVGFRERHLLVSPLADETSAVPGGLRKGKVKR
jgi:hypothetical protein